LGELQDKGFLLIHPQGLGNSFKLLGSDTHPCLFNFSSPSLSSCLCPPWCSCSLSQQLAAPLSLLFFLLFKLCLPLCHQEAITRQPCELLLRPHFPALSIAVG
jgi:hypothetical protein